MKSQCEIMATQVIPRVRAEIARRLATKYGMKQTEIAARLDITQAAVSLYLTELRATNQRLMAEFPGILAIADDLADDLYHGEKGSEELLFRDIWSIIAHKIEICPSASNWKGGYGSAETDGHVERGRSDGCTNEYAIEYSI